MQSNRQLVHSDLDMEIFHTTLKPRRQQISQLPARKHNVLNLKTKKMSTFIKQVELEGKGRQSWCDWTDENR